MSVHAPIAATGKDGVPSMDRRVVPDLPVFRVPSRANTVIYAPGQLAWLAAPEASRKSIPQPILAAAAAVDNWATLAHAPFMPVGLTLNLTNHCKLNCRYCFARTADRNARPEQLDLSAILAAAQLVMDSCRVREKPFQLVFTGGGEPTLAWGTLQAVVSETQALAQSQGVEWRSYISTNGCVPKARLRWLARNISTISLSCDGPPEIHDLQRPAAGRRRSHTTVERAAMLLRGEGCTVSVRATVTPASVMRQSEMVRWIFERLGAREMRFEPVFAAAPGMEFHREDASRFVCQFMAAQRVAVELGADLSLSGVRLDELHGPHCNVLKDVLHLRPDGTATACFLATTGKLPGVPDCTIGYFDRKTGEYRLDTPRIAQMRSSAARIPSGCMECWNAYHCARSCPDRCYLNGAAQLDAAGPDFRCRVARQLTAAWLVGAGAGRHVTTPGPAGARIKKFFEGAEEQLDANRVIEDWTSLGPDAATSRSLPAPLWARRGFQLHGIEAWRRVSAQMRSRQDGEQHSVYVHVPFCRRHCGFCDCYTEPALKPQVPGGLTFTRALLAEIDAWRLGRPLIPESVTTVHFGGGTSNSLPQHDFEAIVAKIRESMGINPATEWALESTTSLLTTDHLKWLWDLGFTRLHVGIQTLEQDVRAAIGRRESGEIAALRLSQALEMGFIVSADLIYGLPGQTAKGWLKTLDKLVCLGIDGISLYGLQTTERNRLFLSRLATPLPGAEERFALFHAAHQFLLPRGYAKNHFSHFAKERDLNLYYRHALRRENLLALGPSADGVFGPFLYRHPLLAAYSAGNIDGGAFLEGAYEMSAMECELRNAEAELLANAISWRTFETLGLGSLLGEWQTMGLTEPNSKPSGPQLSAAGSWEIASMMQAMTARLDPHTVHLSRPA
jgi:coproporphyrinogen III oxidase-like Fe-S oxidoreductase